MKWALTVGLCLCGLAWCSGCPAKPTMSFSQALYEGNAAETESWLFWEAGRPVWSAAGMAARLAGPIDKTGRSPLHVAAEFGHIDVAELLLDRGADIDTVGFWSCGCTPLQVAEAAGQTEMVVFLISRGAREGPPPGEHSYVRRTQSRQESAK